MFKVLLADDDEYVLEGFRKKVNWSALETELVGTAANGLDALHLIEQTRPDILITDIKMPLIDGLELIAKAQELNESIKIIIISGYGEFDYAQKALKLKALDYLLKPTSKEEIEASVRKLVENIKLEKKEHLRKERLELENKRQSVIVTKHVIMNILEDRTENVAPLPPNDNRLDHDLFQAKTVISLLEIDDFRAIITEPAAIDKKCFVSNIISIIEESLRAHNGHDVILQINEPRFVLVLFYPQKMSDQDIANSTHRILGNIQNQIQKNTNSTVTIAYGHVAATIFDSRKSYLDAFEALKYKLLHGKNSLIRFADVEKIEPKDDQYYLDSETALLESIEKLPKENIFKQIDAFFEKLLKDKQCSYQYIISVSFRLVLLAHKLIQLENSIGHELLLWEQLTAMETAAEIHQWIKDTFHHVLDQIETKSHHQYSSIVGYIINYILKNYPKDIYLKDIAKELYLSENHLSALFKKGMGISFKKYLIDTRIAKAKGLLTNPKYKIFEIANLIGYENEEYFCNLFKEHVGVTPKEYRNQNMLKPD